MTRIIEISGVPGSGKTSLLRMVQGELNDNISIYDDSLLIKNKFINLTFPVSVLRRIGQLYILLTFVVSIFNYKKILQSLASSVWGIDCGFWIKLYIYYNILLKFARYDYASRSMLDKVFLFDEGLTHIPFNLQDYKSQDIVDIENIFSLFSNCLNNIDLIVISAESGVLESRLKIRGHKRMIQNQLEIHSFVEKNQRLIKGILTAAPKFCDRVNILSNSSRQFDDFIKIIQQT